MSDAALWWHELPNRFLVDVLSAINYSRCRNETVDRCQHLSGALNQMWNAFYEYRKGRGRLNQKELENEKEGRVADNQSIQELILHGITDEQGSAVCGTDCVRRFCEFTPQIMNQRTLKNGNFDASNISDELRRRATKEHRDLLGAFRKWETTPSVANKTRLLQKLAFQIYVVRCN